jgi:AcrR family transcriptional regulator
MGLHMAKPRPTNRRQKALVTRRRMLRAAYRLFCASGYATTTIEGIAKASGVAVQTVYFTFHTKGAILNETVGAAILGFDRWDPRAEAAIATDPRQAFIDFHAWYPALEKAKTTARALGVFVDASMAILARVSPLVGVVSAAAASDPDVKAMADVGERRRVEAYGFVVEILARRGGLRRGVTVRRATDIVLTILSGETYQHLVSRRRWSTSECRRWFLGVLGQQLLPVERRTRAAARARARRSTRGASSGPKR